jgi:hypothetical protein
MAKTVFFAPIFFIGEQIVFFYKSQRVQWQIRLETVCFKDQLSERRKNEFGLLLRATLLKNFPARPEEAGA